MKQLTISKNDDGIGYFVHWIDGDTVKIDSFDTLDQAQQHAKKMARLF